MKPEGSTRARRKPPKTDLVPALSPDPVPAPPEPVPNEDVHRALEALADAVFDVGTKAGSRVALRAGADLPGLRTLLPGGAHHARITREAREAAAAGRLTSLCLDAAAGAPALSVALVPGTAGVTGYVRQRPAPAPLPVEADYLYDALVDLLPEAILFCDVRGRLLFVNPAAARLVGTTRPMDLIGTSVWDLLPAADRKRAAARVEALRQGQRVEMAEQTLARLDGATVAVETASCPVRYRGRPAVLITARDISARHRAAEAEREAQALRKTIFEAGPVPIAITRMADDHFLDLNDEYARFVGFSREELLGRTPDDLGLWADPAQRRTLAERLHGGQAVYDFEVDVRTATGAMRTALASFQFIPVGGQPSLLSVLTDITERKRVEEALVAARNRAEEMAHVKSAFLTNMTHEVRTPLTVILGFTSILRQAVGRDYQRFVRVIERSGRRLLLMLDSILDLAQLEAGTVDVEAEPFNVQDLIHNAAETIRPLAEEKGLSFDVDEPEERLYAACGYRIILRVLNNLLDNAVKFTEEGGVTVHLAAEEATVRLTVADTGIGIDETFIPHMFDEFSQESTGLERTHQGSGLGLAVSRRLVELVGGNIDVESTKGKGSRITLTLPRASGGMRPPVLR